MSRHPLTLPTASSWPLDRLGEALQALAQHSGLLGRASRQAEGDPRALPGASPPDSVQQLQPGELARWIDWAGTRLGLQADEVTVAVPELGEALRRAAPAVVAFRQEGGLRFVMLLGAKRGRLRVLSPDGHVHACPLAALHAAVCDALEKPMRAEVDRLLAAAGVPALQQDRTRRALLDQRLSDEHVAGLWLLRLPATAPYRQQLWQARLPHKVLAVVALFAAIYGLEILGWKLIGEAALGGNLDLGWMAAWMLLLVTVLPLRTLSQWTAARFALDAGRLLKQRLLAGALRMDLDLVRHLGAGEVLARVIESQALEAQGLGGSLGVLVALLELGLAAWVLSQGAAPIGHLGLLGVWAALVALLAWRYSGRLSVWTGHRLALTHKLVESMIGHRTRLAQEQPARRDGEEDSALHAYAQASHRLDQSVLPIAAWAPGGWLVLSLLALAPPLLGESNTPALLGISVGGILLAHRALGGVSSGLGLLAGARVAWRQVAPLFRAAGAPVASQPYLPPASPPNPANKQRLVDASGLGLRYRAQGEPVLNGVDLQIDAGERILLQGESGGGKSSLAALLVGLRPPSAGLLLLGGLDRATLGDQWHRLATEAPQFHDNHLLAASLAFNLLMGRRWPPSPGDLDEAAALCEELGLGDLLARMPAGLQQRIGETGWQLSHGEQGRVFLARALLQRAPLTILDESFAALDPPTLKRCLDTALRRSQALVVIAHP